MENKYQEAKDFIKSIANNEYLTDIFDTSLDTLQELIDIYSKLSQFDRAVFFNANNANGVCVEGITYEQLEKALDKICKLLAQLPDGCPSPSKCIGNCEKCWKEWALESEDTE